MSLLLKVLKEARFVTKRRSGRSALQRSWCMFPFVCESKVTFSAPSKDSS